MKKQLLFFCLFGMSLSLQGMEKAIVLKEDPEEIPTAWQERPPMPLEHDVHSLKTLCLERIIHDGLDYDAALDNIKLLIEQAFCGKYGTWSEQLTSLTEYRGLDGPLFVLYGLPANLTPEMVKAHHEGSQKAIQRASETALSQLDLSYLALLFLPAEIDTTLTRCTDLNLADNQLISIDTTSLTQCYELFLTNNQLTSIDTSPLTRCQKLWLNSNQLTSIDTSGLTQCTYLDLSYNQLTTIDTSPLTRCQKLWLNSNQLTSIETTPLTRCKGLYLNNNQLTEINTTPLTQCEWLYLDNNQLSSIDTVPLTQCTYLCLTNNQLTSIDTSGLTQCLILNLSNNQLISIDTSGLTWCKWLILSGNPDLTELDLAPCENLHFLQLDQQLFEEETVQSYLTEHAFTSVTELDWYKDAPEGEKTDFILQNLCFHGSGLRAYYIPDLSQPRSEKRKERDAPSDEGPLKRSRTEENRGEKRRERPEDPTRAKKPRTTEKGKEPGE